MNHHRLRSLRMSALVARASRVCLLCSITWGAFTSIGLATPAFQSENDLAGEVSTDFLADPVARTYWYALYLVTLGALVAFRLLAPAARAVYHDLRVDGVEAEGPGVVSLRLRGRRLDRLFLIDDRGVIARQVGEVARDHLLGVELRLAARVHLMQDLQRDLARSAAGTY